MTARGIIAAAVLLSLACDPVQPKPQCKTRRQEYAAKYIVQGAAPGNCMGKVLSGELLHLATFAPDPRKEGDTPGVGIEPESVAHAVGAAEEAMVKATVESEYSFGKFTSLAPTGDDDLCHVDALPATKVAVPAIPADPAHMRAASPAVSLTYEWSNFRSLVKATSNGLHIGANLKRTDGACVMTYKVSAVTPVVFCGDGKKEVVDPETMMPVVVGDPTTGKPVPGLCCPGKVNGLSRDVAYECDAATLTCVPPTDFPSLDTAGANLKCTNPDEPM